MGKLQEYSDRSVYEAGYVSFAPASNLYASPRWLDIVCGREGWLPLLFSDGDAHMFFPLYAPIHRHLSQPPHTQYLGPIFSSVPTPARQRLFLDAAACRLRMFRSVNINTSPELTDWLPFYWEGYRQTTRYTNVLSFLDETDDLYGKLNQNLRRKLKAANEEGLKVCHTGRSDELLPLCVASLSRTEATLFYPHRLERLIERYTEADTATVTIVTTPNGRHAAGCFTVRAGNTLYYIAGGQDLLISKNALALALYEAIRYARSLGDLCMVDFEGSMLRGVDFFFRCFGARQQPYFSLSRGKMGVFTRVRRKFLQD